MARAPSYEQALQSVEQAVAAYRAEVIHYALPALVARAPSYQQALERIDQAARDLGPGAAIHPLPAGLGHRARDEGDFGWAATCYRRSLVPAAGGG